MLSALVLGISGVAALVLLPPVALALLLRLFVGPPGETTGVVRRLVPRAGRAAQPLLAAVPDISSGGRKAS